MIWMRVSDVSSAMCSSLQQQRRSAIRWKSKQLRSEYRMSKDTPRVLVKLAAVRRLHKVRSLAVCSAQGAIRALCHCYSTTYRAAAALLAAVPERKKKERCAAAGCLATVTSYCHPVRSPAGSVPAAIITSTQQQQYTLTVCSCSELLRSPARHDSKDNSSVPPVRADVLTKYHAIF
ncbi:unnamed protein product [Trichogramma brassicae]|uniref:Uncharacterized protein n=1 Tax=Trichogramma brassicae TaxID=86971 RepID=A0A6H5I1L6_9HYME|nr:unnamed protein product [Trichogramma brassicae]